MGFKEAVRTCLAEKYVTFSGRASRSEYWWYTLFLFLAYLVIVLIGLSIVGFDFDPEAGLPPGGGAVAAILGIFALGTLLPTISVVVRRLHDRDMSGWWYLGAILAGFIPFVGFLASIALLVITILKGTDGPNRFGPDPLALQGGSDVFA